MSRLPSFLEQMAESDESFVANILAPGSSLQPKFLLVLDVAFSALLAVLLTLAYLTSANYHILILTGIELSLWATVKWRVKSLTVLHLALNFILIT
jgi:hypothetical protein